MTVRKAATRPSAVRQYHGERLKDEDYRQMLRLEANRPGSELDLAMLLLRAWVAEDSDPNSSKSRDWLKKICPICLLMIEAKQQVPDTEQPCIQ